jgi:hypothetical protein
MKYLTLLAKVFVLMFLLFACSINNSPYTGAIVSPYPSATIGDTIQLGRFDWLVLDIQDGRALIISEKVLSQRVWHYEQQILTWELSDIRQYLNGEFFDNTFSEEEKALIVETRVVNNVNPWFGTVGAGLDTMDRVFLLSVEEVVQYFGDSGMLNELAGRRFLSGIVLTDEYNYARTTTAIASCIVPWWWLRTPGFALNPRLDASAAAVTGGGDIIVYGIYMISEGGIRPALWIRI